MYAPGNSRPAPAIPSYLMLRKGLHAQAFLHSSDFSAFQIYAFTLPAQYWPCLIITFNTLARCMERPAQIIGPLPTGVVNAAPTPMDGTDVLFICFDFPRHTHYNERRI